MDVLFSQTGATIQPGSTRTPSRSLSGYRYAEVAFSRENLVNPVTLAVEAQFEPAGPFLEVTRATIDPWVTDGKQLTPTDGVIGFGWRDSNAPRFVQVYVDTPAPFVADIEVRAEPA